jgi:DNA polymerase I-like protein with 3'-5' exonuclease and polymerase domains
MPLITTLDDLDEMVDAYTGAKEFVFDVETIGDDRINPHVAQVAWISLAKNGRSDVIPMRHPNGERLFERPMLSTKGVARMARGVAREDLNPKYDLLKETEQAFGPPPKQLSTTEVFDALRPVFFSDALKIGHNIKFDLHAVKKYLGGHPVGPYYDTLIASWLLDVTRKGWLSLADCVKREFGVVMEKGVGKDISLHTFDETADYSRLDSEWTWNLKHRLDEQYAKASPATRWLLDLEHEVIAPVIEMESTGTRIDKARLKEIGVDLLRDLESLEADIYREAGRVFNINSNREKQRLLFGKKRDGGLALKPLKLTPSAKDKEAALLTPTDFSVDHETLARYEGVVPLVDLFLKHSAKAKLHSTYVIPYLGGTVMRSGKEKVVVSRVSVRERIHASFVQNGAESGRFSSREPNLQNIPSRTEDGKKLREIFVADEGACLVVADYSQIEPRIIAALSGDKTMIRTYKEGGDVYQVVGDRMGLTRPTGKELVLSIAYGIGAPTISTRIGCSVNEAMDLMEFFKRRFPAIPKHKALVLNQCRKNRYSETVLGRRRPLPGILSRDSDIRSSAERQGYNHVIQGTAADIMKIALVNMYTALPEGALMLLTVHDEVVVQCPQNMLEEVSEVVRSEMEGAKPRRITVPLVADISSGHSWSEAKK